MAEKLPVFTVDWEDWNHALHVSGENRISEPTRFLLTLLKKYRIKAIFYILDRADEENYGLVGEIVTNGHFRGSHGRYHDHNEYERGLFRSPYWDTTPMPYPPSGGFFFRLMPLWYLKWAVKKSGVFWIHPHDLDEGHLKLRNLFMNWKRHVGLKTSREKLERLLSEIKFCDPN